MRVFLPFVAAAALVAVVAAPGAARDFPPEVDREAAKVFGEVMSPFCPGKLIADCPSPDAMQLREDIRERIAGGDSAATIRAELYETYGETLRAAPTGRGFDLAAWVVPPLVVALGAVALLVWIRRRRIEASPPGSCVTTLDAESKALIEAELSKLSSRD